MKIVRLAAVATLCFLWAGGVAAQAPTVAVTGTPLVREQEGFTRLGRVRELQGDSLQVLVQDPQAREVTLVNLRTASRRQIGRAGSGPREYIAPGTLFSGPQGTTLFGDAGLRKVLRVSADAATIDEVSLPSDGLGRVPTLLGIDDRGSLVGFGRNALYLAWQDPETDLMHLERWRQP